MLKPILICLVMVASVVIGVCYGVKYYREPADVPAGGAIGLMIGGALAMVIDTYLPNDLLP